jgi:2-polyprenyl-3-methyl-5-hydroxy-6-metoxy-1,4-benzoquinol methylase
MVSEASSSVLPDLGPDIYAKWPASGIGAITEQLQRRLILTLLGDIRGRNVLDVGCGDGDLAVELWRRGAIVTGIDASSEMVEAARARAKREGADIALTVGEAASIPFDPERFDVVVAVTILCFVAHAAPVFNEIARVLRPGGILVIGELGKWSLWAAARRVRAWFGSPLWRRGRFRTASELRSLARGAGLVPALVHGSVYYPRWRWAALQLAPYDAALSRVTTFGAAFLALSAVKPTTGK